MPWAREQSRSQEDRLVSLLAAWPDESEGFRSLCEQKWDWDGLLRLAEWHGVLGILSEPIQRCNGPLPGPLKERIDQYLIFLQLWDARLRETLGQILLGLEKARIRAVSLKGPALGQQLYGNSSLRFSTDLDLLVDCKDLDSALSVLESQGYRAPIEPSRRYHLRYHHHLLLFHPTKPSIDLHFRLYTGFGVIIPGQEYLERSIPYHLQDGITTRVLAPEHQFLFLALHGAGHGFERLAWLYDLKSMVHCFPNLNWRSVWSQARALDMSAAFSYALLVLQRRLNIAILPGQKSWGQYDGRRRLANALLASRDLPSPLAKLGTFLFQACLCETTGKALWFLHHHIWRVTRRRLQTLLPFATPEDWAG